MGGLPEQRLFDVVCLSRPRVAKEIFGTVDGILAWGPAGGAAEAERVPGGYCISGTWRFASGSQNATWLGAHMKVAGTREIRTMLFPKSSIEMVDIWHTLGLRGTASNEYVVKDLFVPGDHTLLRDRAVTGGRMDRCTGLPAISFTRPGSPVSG